MPIPTSLSSEQFSPVKFMVLTPTFNTSPFSNSEIAEFLHEHLERFGDPIDQIKNCLDYALSTDPAMGGMCVLAYQEPSDLLGACIINQTKFKGYIPNNMLVYIAVRSDTRGRGIGKSLMLQVQSLVEGDIALHVEPDNPARFLYEKCGFSSKYVEMRYSPE
ncbi:hypothetical protein RCL1_006772 [Eukaryota sp. TZLM3-RCL]